MRKNVYLLLCLLSFSCANAQNNLRQNADVHISQVVGLYNRAEFDSLYDLGGPRFKKYWGSRTDFLHIGRSIHKYGGLITTYRFSRITDTTVYYTASLEKDTVSVGLIYNKAGRMVDLLFGTTGRESDTATSLATPNIQLAPNEELSWKKDSLANAFMRRNNTASLAVGVLNNGWRRFSGYGSIKKEKKHEPTVNTLYEIGSITKTFTGILLAYFVEQKKVKLDDPINKYLPDSIPAISFNGKPVTLASLSNHSSGLPRLPSNLFDEADMQNPYKHYDDQRLFRFLKNFKLTREPGAQYEYSNLAVGLLGVILERVSKKTYEQLVKEIICEPLFMSRTHITLNEFDSAFFAQGYRGEAAVHSWEFQSLVAAGGIRSCVEDMLTYAAAQVEDGNTPLHKAIALSHQMTYEKNGTRVALGWHLLTRNGKTYLFHNGQTGGYYTVLLVNRESKKAVVMLTNALVDPMGTAMELMTWLDK